MVDVGDKGIVYSAGTDYSRFAAVSTPEVGDQVIVIPLDGYGDLAVPCLTFAIGEWVWVMPEFKFAGFDWKMDLHFNLIPVAPVGGPALPTAWVLQNDNPGWVIRYSPTLAAPPDGSVVLIGGANYSTPYYKNDVWRSTDNGANWTQMTAAAGWTARFGHTSVALADGSIVVMGGYTAAGVTNDVWRSTDNGANWTQMTAAAGWTARYGHTSVAMPDGSIVLMGGNRPAPVPCVFYNDVWRSTDNGANWTQMTAAAGWTARFGHTSVVLADGSIVIMTGRNDVLSASYNDVWRSTDNGANWTQMTADAEWSTRYASGSVAIGNTIILMGGNTTDDSFNNDVWVSSDCGATWTKIADAGWIDRTQFGYTVLPDYSIVVACGIPETYSLCKDVWRYA